MMDFEIDFLPVGDPGEDGRCRRSGDAIAFRFGQLRQCPMSQVVGVIDGGFRSSGEKLCEHISQYYGTRTIDWVFSSHPHDDHIQGLFPVLETCEVKTLLIHRPWLHAAGVDELIADTRTTVNGTRRRLRESFSAARELCTLAESKNIQIVEPFEGTHYSPNGVRHLLVLGPSKGFYHSCIAADVAEQPLTPSAGGLLGLMAETVRAGIHAVMESWDNEKLVEPAPNAADPLNQSSTVIYLDLGLKKFLLTADVGVQGLTLAHEYAATQGVDLRQCTHIQVPHHGSKRNVGPAILNKILGPVLPFGAAANKTGMLSCATDGEPKHPSARVTNAFYRRGARISPTKGQTICFMSEGIPIRPGWGPVPQISFQSSYSEED